jgi:integrase/recombinase XerD
MKPIYDVDKYVESAKLKLQNSNIPDDVKQKIREFVAFMREANGISKHRENFYLTRLKILACVMGSSILKPSKNDVINAIGRLKDTRTNR